MQFYRHQQVTVTRVVFYFRHCVAFYFFPLRLVFPDVSEVDHNFVLSLVLSYFISRHLIKVKNDTILCALALKFDVGQGEILCR